MVQLVGGLKRHESNFQFERNYISGPDVGECGVVQGHASLIISDFNSQNPLSFGFPGTTWVSPINQFESFTSGSIIGQEVLSIGGGNPTVGCGAGVLGLNLNISGDDRLGTVLRFSYPIGDFNVSTFTPATLSFSGATTTAAGSTPGFNKAAVAAYEIQGDFFDAGGAAPFRAQFDSLIATTSVPEPSSGALLSLGVCSALVLLRFKRA